MNALCGWLGADAAPVDENELRTRLLSSRIHEEPGARSIRIASGPGWALALDAHHGAIAVREGMAIAAMGDVRWADEDLARVAAQDGLHAALVAAYTRHGDGMLERMLGTFSIAVLDTRTRRALLAIDRMGVATLCYRSSAREIAFGTDADLVFAKDTTPRQLSSQGIYNYLYLHAVPSPGTIYEGVAKLLPAQLATWRAGQLDTRFWWALRYHENGRADFDQLAAEFRELLRRSVQRRLNGGEVGAFLSGGTDSSTVTGLLSELRPPADTYSIGFEADGFDEMAYARISSRHFGARAHEYYVTPKDVVDAVPKIAAAYDEPFGNASAVPTYYCALRAAEDGKDVVLAGDGGDEIFGGNSRYAKQQVFELYWRMPRVLRSSIEPLALNMPSMAQVGPVRKLASYVRQARVPLPERLYTYVFLEREALSTVLAPDFMREIDPDEPRRLAREVFVRAQASSAVDRMMHLDLKETLADNDLRKVNRMCALAGVEVRYPMLDDELVAFSGRLPAHYKVNRLTLRWFFKRALTGFLAPETIAKTKHGFGLPFGLWLQQDRGLYELSNDSLDKLRARRYINPAYIDELMSRRRADHATYYGVMIWVLMMLEQWLEAHRL